jgi:hypothetical protein
VTAFVVPSKIRGHIAALVTIAVRAGKSVPMGVVRQAALLPHQRPALAAVST